MEALRRRKSESADFNFMDEAARILRFPNAPERAKRNEGEEALNLIYQAAKLVRGVEDRAAATEARARDLTEMAVARLQSVTEQLLALEAERHAADAKLQDSAKALVQAEAHIASLEQQLAQSELRTSEAQAKFSDMERSVERITEAIRVQLLQHGKHPARH